MQTDDSLEKSLCWERLRAEGEEGSEDEMAGWHHQCKDMNLGKLQETVRDREAWGAVVTKSQTQLDD